MSRTTEPSRVPWHHLDFRNLQDVLYIKEGQDPIQKYALNYIFWVRIKCFVFSFKYGFAEAPTY